MTFYRSFAVLSFAIPLVAATVTHDSLVTALEAKFPPNKTGSNAVVFVIQREGVLAYPPGTLMMPENRVVDGNVAQSRLLGQMNMTAVPLAPGTPVYVTRIESKNEMVKVHVSTMDKFETTVIGLAAQKRLNAVLAFKFPKEFLNGATAEQVTPQIAAMLAPDSGGRPEPANAGGAPPPPAAPAAPETPKSFDPIAPPPPPPDAAPAAPAAPAKPAASISMGQTEAQVANMLGQPQKINDLPGKKKQYVYPDLKITFTNGKVSDVQ